MTKKKTETSEEEKAEKPEERPARPERQKKHRPTKGKGRTVRHGGRKPGTWQFGLTAEKIRAWRNANSVSRKVLAQRLGVSSTSVQNWENGICPIRRTQESLVEVMQGTGDQPASPSSAATAETEERVYLPAESGKAAAAIKATSEIVSSFLAKSPKAMDPESLPLLVGEIRRALL